MNKISIKKWIINHKISLLIITFLLVIIVNLLHQRQGYKFTLLYQYQTVPDIELINTLVTINKGLVGEIRGFVKFDNVLDQPKDLRQYYIIKPLNKFTKDSRQYFSLEEVVKVPYVAPTSLGFSELIEVGENGNVIILEDQSKNSFFY